MGPVFAQIFLNDTTDKTITGVYTFDRTNGGTLIIPAGTSFPGTPVAGELFWRTDLVALYRRDDANANWETQASTATTIKMKDFINAPVDDFASGLFRTVTMGTVAPSNITWWTDNTQTTKIFESNYTRNAAQVATSIEHKLYDTDGVTVLKTVTDAITYSGIIETSRTRTIV
jgi:hypothetical protein